MPYTLISSVGTGMYKDKKYQETTYVFPDGKSFQTRLFLESLIRCKYRDINTLILVGTETSSWDALIDDSIDEQLWLCVYEKVSTEGIKPTDALIPEIAKHISARFDGIKVILKVHTPRIDSDTTEQIFQTYNSLVPEIEKGNDILFDITHGFRSMPILLYQALQYSVSQNENINQVELVYGEYNPTSKNSAVRNLSSYWRYSQITDAISIFKNKLDGTRLASLIKNDYDKVAKTITAITEIVQTNFSLQIIDVIARINNLNLDGQDDAPFWFKDIGTFLLDIKKLKSKSKARTLYNYAEFLFEKKMNVQALIALELSVETAFAEKYGDETAVGNYEWWRDFKTKMPGRSESLKEKVINSFAIDEKQKKEMRHHLIILEIRRNSSAHGGARDRNSDGAPSAANIPNIFKSGYLCVGKVLELLDL